MASSDLFQIWNSHYLLTVDYFSCYPELTKLSSTSAAIIGALKTISWDLEYLTLYTVTMAISLILLSLPPSPKAMDPILPQSNGLVERIVKTVKHLLQQSNDHCLVLLNFRSTPLPWCNLSTAELLIGWHLRTKLPQIPQHQHCRTCHSSGRRTRSSKESRKGTMTNIGGHKHFPTFLRDKRYE